MAGKLLQPRYAAARALIARLSLADTENEGNTAKNRPSGPENPLYAKRDITPSICTLPDDVLLLIFAQLEPEDLLICATV